MGNKLKQSKTAKIIDTKAKDVHEEHLSLLRKTKKNKDKIKHLKEAAKCQDVQQVQHVNVKKKKKVKRVSDVSVFQEDEATNIVETIKTKKSSKKNKIKHLKEAAECQDVQHVKVKKKKKTVKQESEDPISSVDAAPIKIKKTSKKIKNKKLKTIQADNNVVTSESESENEYASLSEAKQQQTPKDTDKKLEGKSAEEMKENRFPGREHSIFIGNLPNTVKQSTMKELFKQFGKILTIRFRKNDGVKVLNKKDRTDAKALNCYIRFETSKEAEAACTMNGHTVEGNYIRVSLNTQKQLGHITSTVFVGNIHHKTTDNELYDFFNRVGDIEYVRQIANRGIGYVCYKKGVSIAKALKLNQQLLNGRPLRIMKVDPNLQFKRRNKKGNLVSKNKLPAGTAKPDNQKKDGQKGKDSIREFHGTTVKAKNGKRQKPKQKKIDKKKKILAQKLKAAGAPRKNT